MPTDTMLPIDIEAAVNDDDVVLTTVRRTRLQILAEQTATGLPSDKDGFQQLHDNLKELDKAAFSSKRLKQDESDSARVAAIAMATASAIISKAGKTFLHNGGGEDVGVDRLASSLSDIEGSATPVEGELDSGGDTPTYDEFMATTGAELDRARREVDDK